MRHAAWIALAVLLAGSRTAAQEPLPAGAPGALRLTLDEVIARGTAASRRLAELDARQAGADAAAAARRAAALPVVSLSAGYMRTNHVEEFAIRVPGAPPRVIYPDIPDNTRARLDLQWPVYTGGRTGALERAARAEREAAGADLAAARADLRLELTRAFWALVTARDTEGVASLSVRSLDAHVADARSRFDQGLIPPNDVLSAEAQRARTRVLAIEAASTRAIAEADLARLLDLEGAPAIEPLADLVPPPPQADPPAALVARALDARPERIALSSRVEAFRARTRAAESGGRPQVAFTGGYDYARPNPRIFPRIGAWRESWDLSVGASWLLFDGGRRRAEVAEAQAGARGAEARAADFDRQVSFEVRQRRLELDAGRAAVAAADDAVASAAEARRVVGERAAAGVAIDADLLDAELALLQARLDRTRAVAASRLAAARLDRAIGR